jgi:hypothetical protein
MRSIFTKTIISGSFLFIGHFALAQTDTVRIMEYNLLNYGGTGNTYAYKDPRLTTIVQHAQPDLLAVNELASGSVHSQNLLNSVLGTNWSKGSYINTNNEIQTNMLFWKTSKFGLKSEQSICYNLRDIIAYRLYYKDTITIPHDTVFLTVMVAHLKASQGTAEEAARAAETQAVVNYLNGLGTEGNYILLGDFNMYTSTELGYQNLVNSPSPFSKLYDPINMPGDWNNNSTFASVHTQATRTAQLQDGGVNGGLDDRFDIQLVSNSIMTDAKGMRYLPGSYKAMGQDGLHFNDALTDPPTNTSAPFNVIQALYQMSDHLPVYADYIIHPGFPAGTSTINNIAYNTTVVNPIINNKLSIRYDERLNGETVNIQLYSIQGSIQFTGSTTVNKSDLFRSYDLENMSTGIYFLRITSTNGYSYFAKVINN